jgi:transposase
VRKAAPKRAEKLDPFRADIVDRLKAAAADRPAVVLFREIKARGYDGGESRHEAVRARAYASAGTFGAV